MDNKYTFPFSSPLKKVEQTDRIPKKVFVLGVYVSAVLIALCHPRQAAALGQASYKWKVAHEKWLTSKPLFGGDIIINLTIKDYYEFTRNLG